MAKRELRVTRGAAKIRRIMARAKMGTTAFAKAAGVHRVTLHKIITGERWQHISVDFALAIRDITNGEVQIEDFASVTAVAAEEEEPSQRRATGTDG